MQERRQFVRLDTRLDASYTVLATGVASRTQTKNVGGGGICLITDEVFAPGTRLQFVLKLPDVEQSVRFVGEVVWSEPYEIIGKTERRRAVEAGVRFVEISPADREAVMRHVILNLPSTHPSVP